MSRSQFNRAERLRSELIKRHGAVCSYCGVNLTSHTDSNRNIPTAMTLDHKVPRSKGGTWEIENMALACLACNVAKGSRSETSFKACFNPRSPFTVLIGAQL